MKKFGMVVSTGLLLVVSTPQSAARQSESETKTVASPMDHQISAKEAQSLEEGLATKPDNLSAREQLISYYFTAMLTSHTPELEEKREKHVFWLIEHHPESELAGSPESQILPMAVIGSSEGYQRGKQLWQEQVEKHPDNQKILRHAAQFLELVDRETTRELLEKAYALDPGETETSSLLAQLYMGERLMGKSSQEQAALAEKALSIEERGLEKAEGEQRFYRLGDLATSAFAAGETEKAGGYASELLQAAQKFKSDWNYGNALHKANIILGRVALKRGDIIGAKQHLLAAGDTPGSPQLDSFGPDMTLAKELLEKGEREAVLTYLESCTKFWKMGGDNLRNWIATVKGGGTPDFSMNLMY